MGVAGVPVGLAEDDGAAADEVGLGLVGAEVAVAPGRDAEKDEMGCDEAELWRDAEETGRDEAEAEAPGRDAEKLDIAAEDAVARAVVGTAAVELTGVGVELADAEAELTVVLPLLPEPVASLAKPILVTVPPTWALAERSHLTST